MAHQAQHLQLVGNVERLAEAAPVRYRQANETSTSSDLQSGASVHVSSCVSSFFFLPLSQQLLLPPMHPARHDKARRHGIRPTQQTVTQANGR